MSDFENMEAVELTMEEMNEIAGGAFKKPEPKAGFLLHQVQPGDTLYKLGKKYHCTVDDIMSWNPKIKNRNMIYDGDWLYIMKK